MTSRAHEALERSVRLFRSWDLTSARTMSLIWVVSRLLLLLFWALFTPESQGDVVYYYEHISAMASQGPAATLQEYPTPVLWLLVACWYAGFGTQVGYVICFVLGMLACDAALYRRLWLTGGRLGAQAAWFWTVFIAAIGPTVFLRFDVVTSVLAGWSLLWISARRPGRAGALAGVGAAIKLWPALLWPALCGDRVMRRRATISFWVTGGGLALVSWWWAGWDRLISPLSYQSGRGLQVESVWATVPMLARAFSLGDYAVTVSRFQAFEIYGPGVGVWSQVASMAMLVGLVGIVAGYVWWLWSGQSSTFTACLLVIAVVLVMIVTNKTFSPQYMIWLGGPVSALIAILGLEPRTAPGYPVRRAVTWRIIIATLVATAATAIVFPIGYNPLVRDTGSSRYLRPVITCVLACRNVVMCVLLGGVIRHLITVLRHPDRRDH